MSAASLIEQARSFGADLIPMGGTLRVRARRPLPADLIAALKTHKAEVLDALYPPDNVTVTEPLTDAERRAVEYAEKVATIRADGRVPPSYASTTYCAACGLVHIFDGAPSRVDSCPWCFNRTRGLPIPRPDASCSECDHFTPDAHGDGGIGSCSKGGPERGQMPCYPHARRQCASFRHRDETRNTP